MTDDHQPVVFTQSPQHRRIWKESGKNLPPPTHTQKGTSKSASKSTCKVEEKSNRAKVSCYQSSIRFVRWIKFVATNTHTQANGEGSHRCAVNFPGLFRNSWRILEAPPQPLLPLPPFLFFLFLSLCVCVFYFSSNQDGERERTKHQRLWLG